MYRAASPVFDLHEFPALRRVKPLPKRRRTSSTPHAGSTESTSNTASGHPLFSSGLPLELINGTLSTQQLIAHAEDISKRISQCFFMPSPIPGHDFMREGIGLLLGATGTGTTGQPESATSNAGNIAGAPASQSPPVTLPTTREGLQAELFRRMTEHIPVSGFPPLGSAGRLDLDAIFAAGFEAGLSGAALAQIRNTIPQSKFANFKSSEVTFEAYVEANREVIEAVELEHRDLLSKFDEDMRRRAGREDEEDDDEDGDGDYVDHLRQPGNTKKRKVPANAGMSPLRSGGRDDGVDEETGSIGLYTGRRMGPDGNYDTDGGDGGRLLREGDKENNAGSPTDANNGEVGRQGGWHPPGNGGAGHHGFLHPGRLPLSSLSTLATASSSSSRVGQLNMILKARGKFTAAMVAGLQHKEMLKARKRQLAAVMGALTQGDTVALDQALSMAGSAYPFGGPLALPPVPSASSERSESGGEKQTQIRLSKRLPIRLARAMKAKKAVPRHPDEIPLPSSGFVFASPSATAERLIATKEEVATLRRRFEEELERQAAKAAKLAAASKMLTAPIGGGGGGGKSSKQRRAEKAQGRAKPSAGTGTGKGSSGTDRQNQQPARQQQQSQQANLSQQQPQRGQQQPPALPQAPPQQPAPETGQLPAGQQPQSPTPQTPSSSSSSSKPKKKKRSALANASNPHHLRNYVPSRLPHSVGGAHHSNPNGNSAQGILGPLPLRFLNAELPPRKGGSGVGGRKKGGGGSNASTTGGGGGGAATTNGMGGHPLALPEDEWICAFCEYDLFFGDDVVFRRAVRNRKKILKRRRRARERAAAAASGVKSAGSSGKMAPPPPPAPANGGGGGDGEEDGAGDEFDGDLGYEPGGNGKDEFGNVPKHQMKTKGGGGTGGTGGTGGQGLGNGGEQTQTLSAG